MTKETWTIAAVGAYFLIFMGTAVGLLVLKVKRRGGRRPVDFKLLRAPGESLRRRIAKFEEDFIIHLGLPASLPVVAVMPAFMIISFWKPQSWTQFWVWVGATIFIFLLALAFALKWAFRNLTRNRADRLGYLGEREVAERLMPLWAKGYRVYHDVPADGAKTAFNLDHVAIGPNGVAVIETKTRRKGKPRPNGADYRVRYDGEKLLWPWGPDFDTPKQAMASVDWTRKFIHERTGITPPVKAIVAIPGWWVDPAPGAMLVVNSKSVESAVEGRNDVVLTPNEIDLIARQFDERCRDVED